MNTSTLPSNNLFRALLIVSLLTALTACWPEQEDRTQCTSNNDCFIADGEECIQGTCTQGSSTSDPDAGDNDTGDSDVEADVEDDTAPDVDAGEDPCERGFSFISGRILDNETGQPIPNARVSTRPASETVTSQADGTYILETSTGFDTTYVLIAERPGWHTRETSVSLDCNDPTSNTEVDALLTQRAITGRIVDGTIIPGPDEEVGAGIAGAEIFITGGSFVLSDNNGFFTIKDDLPINGNTFDLAIEKDLYSSESVVGVKLGEDINNPNPNLTIKLTCRSASRTACGGCGIAEPANAPGGDCTGEIAACTAPQVAQWVCEDETSTACQCVDP